MSDSVERLNAALEGRYRIESELGEGGMATVYLAEDLRHGRHPPRGRVGSSPTMREPARLLVVIPMLAGLNASVLEASQAADSLVSDLPAQEAGARQGLVKAEFLFDSAPFPSVHASTILETNDGLVAAWFGGTREGAEDVGIWISRQVSGEWTEPFEVANGAQPDGTRHPCWNPVLFEMLDGSARLFYKVGPSPRSWGMVRTSFISVPGDLNSSSAPNILSSNTFPVRS